MKKNNIFLILLTIFIGSILTINVKAENARFYEAEYIDGIYMNKYQYSTKTIYYQKARFFRKSDTNEFAYCIEPFRFFEDTANYNSSQTPENLSHEVKDKITKIAHFGYGYKNHTDVKWYAITQLMIWQASDQSGEYYFTDSLNGNRINPYQQEIDEINNYINNYDKVPYFANKEYTLVEGDYLYLDDPDNYLLNYIAEDNLLTINGNHIESKNLKEGNYNFSILKYENIYNNPYIFYQSNNSQNLIKTGNLDKKEFTIKVKVIKTEIELTKLDNDTNTKESQAEAKLDGAIYKVMDTSMNEIAKLTIKNNTANIKNLKFGKYYIKEIKPGIGYKLDEKLYEINISKDNPIIKLMLKNKVIKKKIIIEKKYGENNTFENEKNISFNIINSENKIISTITTDENGIAQFYLPYGNYTIEQINTTEGYQKINSFEIKVENENDEKIELKDLKIPVPNTHIDKKKNTAFINILPNIEIKKIIWLIIECLILI